MQFQTKYRPDIDGLRALAVLAVVAFHAAPTMVPGGFVGVDVFFVISGYLISTVIFDDLKAGGFSFVDFYARRARRILPALLVVLIAVWAIGWFRLIPLDFQRLGRDVAAGAGYVSNIVFWSEAGYFDKSAIEKPLLHLWSLGVEEQFYLLFPLLVFLVWKARINLLILISSAALASFATNVALVGDHPEAAFFLPQSRFWELMIGAALAYYAVFSTSSGLGLLTRNVAALLGLAALIGAVFSLDPSRLFPGWWALIPTTGAALVIAAGPHAWINRMILSNRIAVGIGLISYPLYLWHWPLLSFANIIEGQEKLAGETVLLIVATAFVLALLTYRFIERPIRFGRLPLSRSISAAALAAISVLIIIPLGLGTYAANGFPDRFPTMLQWSNQQSAETMAAYRGNRCFIPTTSGIFSDECVETPKNGQPLLFLWGDSHAADLYPGLRELQKSRGFAIAQFTTSSCPPILGAKVEQFPHCKEINDAVFARLKTLRPSWVIVSAQWYTLKSLDVEISSLSDTLKAIHQAGVPHILVVGPVPVWSYGLLSRLQKIYVETHRVPTRTTEGFLLSEDLDGEIRKITQDQGYLYRSPDDILCNHDGCIVRVGDDPDDVITWDSSHFTIAGSKYLASLAFANIVFER